MRLLVYTSPARGHLYPARGIAAEVVRRGHGVDLYGLAAEVDRVAGDGITVHAIDPRVEAVEMRDWEERAPLKAAVRAFGTWLDRAPLEVAELRDHIAETAPDALLVDANCWGAMALAEASRGPWAAFLPWVHPGPSRDAPPVGPGLPPLGGPAGRIRDALVRGVSNRAIDGALLERVNALRRSLSLAPVAHTLDFLDHAPVLLSLTAEGFDYPRSDWPANVRLVGPSMWSPPGEAPDWLDALADPLVLVTCSTEHQSDRALLDAALAGLPAAGFTVLGTSAAHDPGSFDVPAGSRVERFVSHDAVLARAACVVCHGGLGITQKALAHEVPVVVVPFGRDQAETARRVEVAEAGVRLAPKRLTPRRLAIAVRRAVGCRDGARRVRAAYERAGGPAAAADAIEALVPVRT